MLRSYLKIAWKVLMRRKFFTFISLFGVSFTLMILLVVAAMFDHALGAAAPLKRVDRMLFVNTIRHQMADGHGWMSQLTSIHFVDDYVRKLKTPEKVGITTPSANATAFTKSKLLPLDLAYTDGNFWQIMDYDFLGGRAFTAAEVAQAQHVCVINEATAQAYFGTTDVVGRNIEIDLKRYRVAGVVRNVSAAQVYAYADVWVPYTLSPQYFKDNRLEGDFLVVLLAPSAAAVPAVSAEYQQMMKRIPIPRPKEVKAIYSYADPILPGITRALFAHDGTLNDDNLAKFYALVGGLALLFMLLPVLNLVNLNVTRILERSGEIGVRKAFGAAGADLVGQFLVENLVLALVGGLLGLGLAAGALALVNEAHPVAYAHFSLSWSVFGWGMVLTLIFGLMSGVYPAWKMSRLNPVAALRGGGEQK
jgi:putative ABC transport system permease protein